MDRKLMCWVVGWLIGDMAWVSSWLQVGWVIFLVLSNSLCRWTPAFSVLGEGPSHPDSATLLMLSDNECSPNLVNFFLLTMQAWYSPDKLVVQKGTSPQRGNMGGFRKPQTHEFAEWRPIPDDSQNHLLYVSSPCLQFWVSPSKMGQFLSSPSFPGSGSPR